MIITTNMKVKTPLGVGTVDGCFVIADGQGNEIASGIGVRMPVNETTAKCLKQSNCMTPMAKLNGVWVFQEKELEAIR